MVKIMSGLDIAAVSGRCVEETLPNSLLHIFPFFVSDIIFFFFFYSINLEMVTVNPKSWMQHVTANMYRMHSSHLYIFH